MKHLGYEECSASSQIWACVILIDGNITAFSIDSNGGDITYYNNKTLPNIARHKFRFQMAKISGLADNVTNSIAYIEPYIYGWDGTKEQLINTHARACKPKCTSCDYCTKMIQMNSWKIPSNYPW